jgi:hypothetical protein
MAVRASMAAALLEVGDRIGSFFFMELMMATAFHM